MAQPVTVTNANARRVALGAFAGTALESYDFFLFATAASLVFNRLYFVSNDSVVATIGAFGSFAVGFVARPLGAMIFGHFGDRIGRRRCLIASVTIIGTATGLIGLLPTYTSIGVLAPVLLTLLRLLQGIAIGGEWGGAVTLAMEHAPPERRGRYAAALQLGAPLATLLSSGAFLAVAMLPSGRFDAWGWRLPFLAAFPLLYVALWLRRRVSESPLFDQMLQHDNASRAPVREVFSRGLPQLLIGASACFLPIGGFYLVSAFVISYGTGTLHLPKTLLLAAMLVGALVQAGVLLLSGLAGERFGAPAVVTAAGVLTALLAFPIFALLDTGSPLLVIVGVSIGIASVSVALAVSGPLLADLFPVRRRYSGIALASNLAGVASGLIPLVTTWWQGTSGGGSWPAAAMFIVLGLAGVLGGLIAPRLGVARDRVMVERSSDSLRSHQRIATTPTGLRSAAASRTHGETTGSGRT
jgi:MFS family permease